MKPSKVKDVKKDGVAPVAQRVQPATSSITILVPSRTDPAVRIRELENIVVCPDFDTSGTCVPNEMTLQAVVLDDTGAVVANGQPASETTTDGTWDFSFMCVPTTGVLLLVYQTGGSPSAALPITVESNGEGEQVVDLVGDTPVPRAHPDGTSGDPISVPLPANSWLPVYGSGHSETKKILVVLKHFDANGALVGPPMRGKTISGSGQCWFAHFNVKAKTPQGGKTKLVVYPMSPKAKPITIELQIT
jgi:hypothetical protein